ncbi:AraC family transcriptional regulator [Exiguobacterium alkaliphilum]|uniref:AraC family transcriptional regulator n=1 Tax=Exiguobacterium alkaliphilum TaxID=1428684 RepID=A0ABT2KVH9_9BACL|nr:AraC family transcriptional regulator [Exiguobacterium alkaliphilum]MCT4794962.1 AraC family transcriptional regulator [Exiguobacterium alkaliphilum]
MLESLNRLMDHIDQHLTDEITGQDITRIVGVSDYHFRRMFSYMAGMTLNEYVRNRRLSEANKDLIHGKSVTDVAYTYGYQSVDGFSRAFRDWCGFLPSEVSKNKIQKSFPKFTFFIDIKGGISMEFKLEHKPSFNVVGVSKRVPIQFEGVNNSIVELAQSITEQQRSEMHQLADLYPNQVLNVSYDFDEGYLDEKGSLTHMIGFATTQENPYEDLEQITVASNLWAVFPNTGPFPETLQETMAKTYAEWLPTSEYELADLPSISFTKHDGPSDNVYSEVWVAVKEKKL